MHIFEIGAGIVLALVALASMHEIGIVGLALIACAVIAGFALSAPTAAYGYLATNVIFLALKGKSHTCVFCVEKSEPNS
jgi:hypothetical protein